MSLDVTQTFSIDMTLSLLGGVYLLLTIVAALHVVLNKQNEASAFSWLGIILLAPLLGALLYWLFGINRIRRRAQAELSEHVRKSDVTDSAAQHNSNEHFEKDWQDLMNMGLGIHASPYLPGNSVEPLINGDEAYPSMLHAINQAKVSVVLSSYIFEYDEAGAQFVDALCAANNRGVSVRVLIDGIGVGYGFSLVRSDRVLREKGVKTARFLSTFSTTGTRFINLRNHRKILAVDGEVAFVGGMNIRQENVLKSKSGKKHKRHTQDIHFKVQGPVIDQINAVFASDWLFSTNEKLTLPSWSGKNESGAVATRVLVDGPDDNYQKLQLSMLGAIHAAQRRIQIVTPYFLPGSLVLNALQLAVLRGVTVDICVPENNNLPPVGWAMRANHKALISHGIRIYETPDPFDHSKLFLIDDYWSMIGSSNWDSRSLELNFEINLECYSKALNASVAAVIASKISHATRIDARKDQQFFKRLRNNFFRLFSPYL